jgi:anaerobic ribonucleoside-triphosphate reductase activating protein
MLEVFSFGDKPLLRVVRMLHGDHPSLPSVSVYFQGCDAYPKCLGCHNPETWEFSEEYAVDFERLLNHVLTKLETLLMSYPKASLVLLGGEPLSQRNRGFSYLLAKSVKEHFGDRVITLVYSWRTPKELLDIDIPIGYFDEFVLGRYLHKYHTEGFPASKNQIYITKGELYDILQNLARKRGKEYVSNF